MIGTGIGIEAADPDLWEAMADELRRQEDLRILVGKYRALRLQP